MPKLEPLVPTYEQLIAFLLNQKKLKANKKREQMSSKCSSLMVLTMSPKHYWCHIVYVKSTRSDRVSDTVHFKHKNITQPTITPEDTIVKALNDLTQALKERRNTKGTE